MRKGAMGGVYHERKSDGVRLHLEKEGWGENSP